MLVLTLAQAVPPRVGAQVEARPARTDVSSSASALLGEPPGPVVGVELTTELRRYPVRGADRAALSRSLFDAAPVVRGERVWGRTRWSLESRYAFGWVAGTCAVARARVLVSATVLLPDWRDRDAASPALRHLWDRFLRGLAEHEAGHRARAVEAGQELRAALLELSAPTCREMEQRVEARTRQVMERWQALQLSYDVETRRGRTQGARWPPSGGRP